MDYETEEPRILPGAFENYSGLIDQITSQHVGVDCQLSQDGLEAVRWMQSRERPALTGAAVQGFGPQMLHSLRLPSLGPSTAVRFIGGVPTQVEVPGVAADPELEAMRLEIKDGCRRVESLVVTVPWLMMTYTARLIRINYNVTDSDLDYLLGGQKIWVEGMLQYIYGGNSTVSEIMRSQPGELYDTCLQNAMTAQKSIEPPAPPHLPSRGSRARQLLNRITFWR